MLYLLGPLLLIATVVDSVRAETHTIHFINNCGFGTPTLVQGSNVLSTGDFTTNGLIDAIAYLQTGACGFQGEGCTAVETNLTNGLSCTELLLAPPYEFSLTTGFKYFDGCDGSGFDCTSPSCPLSFPPGQNNEVCCAAPNVNLAITFCD